MKWIMAAMMSACVVAQTLGAGIRECLRKMGETDLAVSASDTNGVSFRFTILPTWGNPVCVRVQQEGKTLRLIAKRLEGQAGYEVGKLVEMNERVLSEEDSTKLLRGLGRVHFFEMQPTKPDEAGYDGESWYLEGIRHGQSHSVERWSADYEAKKRVLDEFVKFCTLLVMSADLKEPPNNKGREIFGRKK